MRENLEPLINSPLSDAIVPLLSAHVVITPRQVTSNPSLTGLPSDIINLIVSYLMDGLPSYFFVSNINNHALHNAWFDQFQFYTEHTEAHKLDNTEKGLKNKLDEVTGVLIKKVEKLKEHEQNYRKALRHIAVETGSCCVITAGATLTGAALGFVPVTIAASVNAVLGCCASDTLNCAPATWSPCGWYPWGQHAAVTAFFTSLGGGAIGFIGLYRPVKWLYGEYCLNDPDYVYTDCLDEVTSSCKKAPTEYIEARKDERRMEAMVGRYPLFALAHEKYVKEKEVGNSTSSAPGLTRME